MVVFPDIAAGVKTNDYPFVPRCQTGRKGAPPFPATTVDRLGVSVIPAADSLQRAQLPRLNGSVGLRTDVEQHVAVATNAGNQPCDDLTRSLVITVGWPQHPTNLPACRTVPTGAAPGHVPSAQSNQSTVQVCQNLLPDRLDC